MTESNFRHRFLREKVLKHRLERIQDILLNHLELSRCREIELERKILDCECKIDELLLEKERIKETGVAPGDAMEIVSRKHDDSAERRALTLEAMKDDEQAFIDKVKERMNEAQKRIYEEAMELKFNEGSNK